MLLLKHVEAFNGIKALVVINFGMVRWTQQKPIVITIALLLGKIAFPPGA